MSDPALATPKVRRRKTRREGSVRPDGPASSSRVLPLARIKVSKRRRRPGDITNLAASIRELGLLNPVTLTRDLKPVAGYHRLEACRSLGWKRIPAQVLDLAEVDAELAEIDENLLRSELTVLERAQELAGALGSVCDLSAVRTNHRLSITGGVCADEARALLREFFRVRRGA